MDPTLDPLILTSLQNAFLSKLSAAFAIVGTYSLNIFYYMAIIELVLFGILWAVRQEPLIGHMLIKLFKLSLIIFVITQYPSIVQTIIDSFALIAFQTVQPDTLDYISNPGKLWEFGFDASLSLLKIAVHYGSLNASLGNLYLVLGLGVLFLFALIGAQILLAMIGFYWVALLGLFLIPFGAFRPLKNMFENALRQLFIQGARIATLIFVIGVGINFWQKLNLGAFTIGDTLDKPLGLFISALIISFLNAKLPALVTAVVGHISSELLPTEPTQSTGTEVNISGQTFSAHPAVHAVAAASNMNPGIYMAQSTSMVASATSMTPGPSSSTTTLTPQSSSTGTNTATLSTQQATSIARSISKETVSKLQQSLRNRHDETSH